MIRLAIVGCGSIANAHLKGYAALKQAGDDRFKLISVCDVAAGPAQAFAEKATAMLGEAVVPCTNLSDMLEGLGLDAVDICVPHSAHHTVAITCLARGCHIMVEKPCGITVKATKIIMKAAEVEGRIVAVAEQIRREKGPRVIEWAINSRKMIGQPRFFFAGSMGQHALNWAHPTLAWRGVKLLTGGGLLLDGGAHFTDMMLHIFGNVESVYCRMGRFEEATVPSGASVDVEDTWFGTMLFESGMVGNWSWSRFAPGIKTQMGVYYGSKGALQDKQEGMHPFQKGADVRLEGEVAIDYEALEKQYATERGEEGMARIFPFGLEDGFSIECWDFIEAVDQSGPPEVDAAQGLKAKALCFAFYEAATSGQVVRVADVEAGRVSTYQDPIDSHWGIR